jgi:anthranilate synthase component 1
LSEPALEPALAAYTEAHARGGGVVWMRRVSDLETPVSAMLKLGADKAGSFLLESVQGGDFRGRYSIIGLRPDLVWRVRDGRAEASRGGFGDSAFRSQRDAPLKSLRKLLAKSALDLPPHLPPMAAGLFGYLGYDMVRLVERLPENAADPIGTPDALLVRPTVVAVFDNVTGEITLITPARKRAGQNAEAAYAAARERLDRVWRALDRPLAKKRGADTRPEHVEPRSNTTPEAYRALVGTCKAYCRAGDIFQVVPSQRFSAPLSAPPFALYRSLRRLNPSPFPLLSELRRFRGRGIEPGDSCPQTRRHHHHSTDRGHAAAWRNAG